MLVAWAVPIAIVVGIAAAVGLALYALWNAFEDFCKTLNETGSIGEALKVGVAKFMGTILGFIPAMILKLVGWVAGLFGFDDFKKKVDAIDPIQYISDTFKGLFDCIEAWVRKLFKDPLGAIKDYLLLPLNIFLNFSEFIYCKAVKPLIDWVGDLFGVSDASGQIEGYVGKQLDKVINFAEEIYIKYIEPIVNWVKKIFGSGVAAVKGQATAIMNMLPDLSGLMPDLPTWDNIKGKIGSLLNDLIQGLAKMMDFKLMPNKVLRGISQLGTDVASSLGVTAASKYIPGDKKMEMVDTKTGVKLNAQQLSEYKAAEVARSAAATGGAAGGPTNIVDASVKTNNTNTGQSGNSPITNSKYFNMNRQEAGGMI